MTHALLPLALFGHSFGERYDLPLPLALFVVSGAAVVVLSFLFVARRRVTTKAPKLAPEAVNPTPRSPLSATITLILLGAIIFAGMFGNQEVAENITPLFFWIFLWIAVPLSCGLVGNWTQALNPFAHLTRLCDSAALRQQLIGRIQVYAWPARLAWWPAAILFFILACGELIFNQFATQPVVIATGLLVYALAAAAMGVLYGTAWLQRGEVFTVIFSTWGKLGYFRFGAPGNQGFLGGLAAPIDAHLSRMVFILLLLVNVSFDGLLATPSWQRLSQNLPANLHAGSVAFQLLLLGVFVALMALVWSFLSAFAAAVSWAGRLSLSWLTVLSGLLPSMLPIGFGYLLAHNLQYILVNGQLVFPLLGNPMGVENWPLHMAWPFNDTFEPNRQLFPAAFYWYVAATAIVLVHIAAVFIAHTYLSRATRKQQRVHHTELPWVLAMVLYTMVSLWLLAQPLVKENSHHEEAHLGSLVKVALHVRNT